MKIRIGGFGEAAQVLDVNQLEIVTGGDDAERMFGIRVLKDGVTLEVTAGNHFEHNKVHYEDRFVISPVASNTINLVPKVYAG